LASKLLKTDNKTYNRITIAIPKYRNKRINTTEVVKKNTCKAFFLKLKFFTFKENKGISAFIMKALKKEITTSTH
jgi:hypothetical protein